MTGKPEWVFEVAEGPGSPYYREVERGAGDPVAEGRDFMLNGALSIRLRYTGRQVHEHVWSERQQALGGYVYVECACGQRELV